ncbi:MAG: ribosomal RNA small subunit methyltransferase A [Crenarchaeota archaeon]|nr:ribosomal RNA small subunit methyltransferase A [Thermoproteota archaeon]
MDLLSWTRSKLFEIGLRPSKRLGQNFTVNPKIVEYFASKVPEGAEVIEIGAGLGTVTKALARKAKAVAAVEKDKRLCELLKELDIHNVKVLCTDALEVELDSEVVVGSLPYSISGPFLAKAFTSGSWKLAVFLLQKEVAERLLARPGSREYGRLTVLARLCCEAEPGPVWGPESFYPRPEVLSKHVVLKKVRSVPPEFSSFLACVFSQRNKKAKKVLPRCGAQWSGEERVRELTPEQLWEAYLTRDVK